MPEYALVTVTFGQHERYEALYADGQLAAEPDGGGAFTAATLLEALAHIDGKLSTRLVELTEEYDEEVVAVDGWPELLEEIPATAVKTPGLERKDRSA